MGRSRRETPIEIDLRDFRRRRQSHKSIVGVIKFIRVLFKGKLGYLFIDTGPSKLLYAIVRRN